MQSVLIAAGAIGLLLALSIALWAVLSSISDDFDGPARFVRFFGMLAVVVSVVAAFLAPNPALALVVGLALAGVIVLFFGFIG